MWVANDGLLATCSKQRPLRSQERKKTESFGSTSVLRCRTSAHHESHLLRGKHLLRLESLSPWKNKRHPLTPDIWTFWTCDILLVFVQDLLAHLITTRPSISSTSLHRCTLSCELIATFLSFFGTFQTCRLPDGGVGLHGGFGICLDHLRLRNGQTDKTTKTFLNGEKPRENGKNIGETQKFLLTYRKFYRTLWWWHFTDFLLNSPLHVFRAFWCAKIEAMPTCTKPLQHC